MNAIRERSYLLLAQRILLTSLARRLSESGVYGLERITSTKGGQHNQRYEHNNGYLALIARWHCQEIDVETVLLRVEEYQTK